MFAPFRAAAIKIERSKHHIADLKAEIDGYFARGGAKIVVEYDLEMSGAMNEHGEMCSFIYREQEPIPEVWSAIIGDAIHNMRAALDLMACDIHEITGGKDRDRKSVHFPFCKNKAELSSMIQARKLGGVGKEFLDAIHAIAPYKDGNPGLRAVHDLDLLDKHQTLVTTLSAAILPWPAPVQPPVHGPPDFRTAVQHDGQRIWVMPRTFCPLPYGSTVKTQFLVLFTIDPFKGSPVIQQLEGCLANIEFIRSMFERIADKTSNAS